MTTQATPAAAPFASDTAAELFALTDEQILDISAEPEVASHAANRPNSSVVAQHAAPLQQCNASATNHDVAQPASASLNTDHQTLATTHQSSNITHALPATSHEAAPPPWLAAQMNDPWSGEDAKEFWHGVQQTKSEAQAYRQAIATPEDARVLKELYPGGVAEARATAERARTLDQIDRAYFGGEGNSPEQRSASRAQLAQQLLREDPAAFREMLAAGLQALQQAKQGMTPTSEAVSVQPRLAKAAAPQDLNVALPFRAASSIDEAPHTDRLGANDDAVRTPDGSPAIDHDPRLAAYAAFERAANDDLERSVGASIDRALTQALPVAQPLLPVLRNEGAEQRRVQASSDPAQTKSSSLRDRLSAGIRAEVEKSLQGDRQLAEQVAQILASRQFDSNTRSQVVRLINDRAQQLVPTAAKRILADWTQTTLAAHRARTQRGDATAATIDVAPASSAAHENSATSSKRPVILSEAKNLSSLPPRRVDYRKLTDEQILNL